MGALRNVMMAAATVGMAVAPATAQEAANSNSAQVTQVAATASVSGNELCQRWAQQARGMFPVVCGDNMSVQVVERGSRDISDDQLVMTIWGGTPQSRLAGLQIIHGMAREGKSVAIAFGPDRDANNITVEFDLFAHGDRATVETSRVAISDIETINTGMARLAEDAYTANFPVRVADASGSTRRATPQ